MIPVHPTRRAAYNARIACVFCAIVSTLAHLNNVTITAPADFTSKTANEELYLCTAAVLPDLPHKLIGVDPLADQSVVHHILLYGCAQPHILPQPGKTSSWACGDKPPCSGSSSVILYGWAQNAAPLSLPEGVGYSVGAGTSIKYIVAQVRSRCTKKLDCCRPPPSLQPQTARSASHVQCSARVPLLSHLCRMPLLKFITCTPSLSATSWLPRTALRTRPPPFCKIIAPALRETTWAATADPLQPRQAQGRHLRGEAPHAAAPLAPVCGSAVLCLLLHHPPRPGAPCSAQHLLLQGIPAAQHLRGAGAHAHDGPAGVHEEAVGQHPRRCAAVNWLAGGDRQKHAAAEQ